MPQTWLRKLNTPLDFQLDLGQKKKWNEGEKKWRKWKGRGLSMLQGKIPGYVYACIQDRRGHTGIPSHPHSAGDTNILTSSSMQSQ